MKFTKCIVLSVIAGAIAPIVLAPASAADPTSHLKSEIDAARSESGCQALQLDPVLTNVAQRVAREMNDYVSYNSRGLPITNEADLLPTGSGGVLRAMREAGYNTSKAKLLVGYGDHRTGGAGDNEAKAIKGAVLEGRGFEALPDCTYTKYGLSALNDDAKGQGWPSTAPRTYAVASVLLAGA